MRSGGWLHLAWLLPASVVMAQETADPEIPPEVAALQQRVDPAAQGPGASLRAALAAQVLGCFGAEGQRATQEDQALVHQAADQLLGQLGGALPAAGCTGAAEAACVAQITGQSCADLAARLSPTPTGPPDSWADAFAGAVANKLLACYISEGASPSAEDQGRLKRFRAEMAQSLTLLTAGGACKVQRAEAARCTTAAAGMPCSSIAAALSPEADGLAEGLLRECGEVLDCGDGDLSHLQ